MCLWVCLTAISIPLYPRYLLFMKMAALQLMQQKANKDTNKTSSSDAAALPTTETSESSSITNTETLTDMNADAAQMQKPASDALQAPATEGADQTDGSTSATSQTTTANAEDSKPAANGPLEPTATQNGECKSLLEGKEAEESIPELAQAKELAESLVAEDGSGIGTSKNTPPGEKEARPGQNRESYFGG